MELYALRIMAPRKFWLACPPTVSYNKMVKATKERKTRAQDVVLREYTVNLHKELQGLQFKRRAPRAVKEVKKFAKKMMGTDDVRLDVNLNKAIWARGVRNVPFRMRILCHRRRNEDEESDNKLYTFVSHVPVATFKGLGTEVRELEE